MTPLKEPAMKKSERLNDMIRFINKREFFNLQNLMDEYGISKSTALRDLSSLEKLGMPIYAEHGRYGRYGILKNRLLSPITFTVDEIYALYFAMLTLDSYQSTPFHISIQKLNEKFENCLPPKQIEKIHKMKKVLQLEVNLHHYISRFLDRILLSILDESSCKILYKKSGVERSYFIQFFKISAKFGQWYATGIELDTNTFRVFRCDRITYIEEITTKSNTSLDDLLLRSKQIKRTENSVNFEVEIVEHAIDIFYKENYPSMSIEIGDKIVIKGFYNRGEEDFITDYLLRYGSNIKAIKPASLKQQIQSKLIKLQTHLEKMS